MQEMQEIWVRSLGQEDTLQKEMATHSSVLPWEIPWTEEPGRMQSMGSQSQTDLATQNELDKHVIIFGSVQSLSRVQLFATPWTAARQASLSITNSWSLLKLVSIESVIPSNHLILCQPLLLSVYPVSESFPMSQFFASSGQSIGVSASVSVLPKNIQD